MQYTFFDSGGMCVAMVTARGGGTYFHLGGGKDKKGHCNVKKGTNGVHADDCHALMR